MLILAIDSSGPLLKTGLYDCDRPLAELESDSHGNHSQQIILQIDRLLKSCEQARADLDLAALNLGPGSFTGLRIGLAVAQGLSAATGIGLAGFNAFEIIREDLRGLPGEFLAVVPCRGEEFYSAWIDAACQGGGELSYRIGTPGFLWQPDRSAQLAGWGAPRFFELCRPDQRESLVRCPEWDRLPTLSALARLVCEREQEFRGRGDRLEPFYLAPSQAEANYERRRSDR